MNARFPAPEDVVITPGTSELKPRAKAETIASDDVGLAIGQWYWMEIEERDWEKSQDVTETHLVCIIHLGSNYAELQGVQRDQYNTQTWRVHFDEFAEECKRCWDPDVVINNKVVDYKAELGALLGEVQRIMGSLAGNSSGDSTALATMQQAADLGKLKTALVNAKDKQIPVLFKQIETASKQLGRWMAAKAIPMRAQIGDQRELVKRIEDQIFNVELYTGLVEDIVHITKGKPAPATEKLHLMQRMHFMDEECLLNYMGGGIRIENIHAFDMWMRRKENRDRLLPFPRCVLAMRVRRFPHKELRGFIDIFDADMKTFLYIRNGKNLYRLATGIDFGGTLFPDIDATVFEEGKLWAAHGGSGSFIVIPDRDYQERIEKYTERLDAWEQLSKKEQQRHNEPRDPADLFRPYDPTHLYYDDINEFLNREAKHYNKIALVLQGLFDRSAVFHPHPPVKLWENIKQHVELIYDQSHALPPPNKPDFELYRSCLNAQLKLGSVTTGQHRAWMKVQADKLPYNERRSYDPEYYQPWNDPGPGDVTRVSKLSRDKTKVSYNWKRERKRQASWRSRNQSDYITSHFTMESKHVLNVSAYTPGDYKQFFDDPRTRADYIQWAPLMLAAEDYHAGKLKLREDLPEGETDGYT